MRARFLACAVLRFEAGSPLGVLVVADASPRVLNPTQRSVLQVGGRSLAPTFSQQPCRCPHRCSRASLPQALLCTPCASTSPYVGRFSAGHPRECCCVVSGHCPFFLHVQGRVQSSCIRPRGQISGIRKHSQRFPLYTRLVPLATLCKSLLHCGAPVHGGPRTWLRPSPPCCAPPPPCAPLQRATKDRNRTPSAAFLPSAIRGVAEEVGGLLSSRALRRRAPWRPPRGPP